MREVPIRNRRKLDVGTTRTNLWGLVLLAALVQIGCTDSSTMAGTPAAWERYQPIAQFSFAGPSDLQPVDAQPVDSAAGVYRSAVLEVIFDYGWFADPLDDATREARSREQVTIGGKEAVLVEYDAGASVHFPNLGGDDRLTVSVRWREPEAAAAGMELLRSIRFARSSGG